MSRGARRKKSWWRHHKQKSKSEEEVGAEEGLGRGADQGELELRNNNNNKAERWEKGMSGDEEEGWVMIVLRLPCRAVPRKGSVVPGRESAGIRGDVGG